MCNINSFETQSVTVQNSNLAMDSAKSYEVQSCRVIETVYRDNILILFIVFIIFPSCGNAFLIPSGLRTNFDLF
jgi:hypothetical protein